MDILSPNGGIIFKGTTENGDSLYDDSSVRDKAVVGANTLSLKFYSTDHLEFPIGSYAFFSRDNTGTGEYYYLYDTNKVTKNGLRNFVYELTLESTQSLLKTRIFKFFTIRNDHQTTPTIDTPYKTKSWYAGTPKDFLQLIVMSMNDGDTGWEIGSYIEGETKNIEFNNENCLTFLQKIADEYKTEWEVVGKTIYLKKVERDAAPIVLSYGKDNGFVPGIVRDKGASAGFNRLLIQGGNRNLIFTRYGNDTLLLPKNRTVVYDGVEYKTDLYGRYIQKAGLLPTDRIIESVLDLSDIYPMRESTVSGVEIVVPTETVPGIFKVTDNTIPEELNYKDTFLKEETPTIAFHSGDFTGREFTIEDYNHSTRTFTLKFQTDGGMMLPNEALQVGMGDKYAVFNIFLPQYYIDDAEEKALNRSVENIHIEGKRKIEISGTVQSLYAKNHWSEIGGKLDVGFSVNLVETDLLPQGEILRIVSVKDYVNKPMKPELTLSNEVKSSSWANLKNDINKQEVVVDRKVNASTNYGARQWWDVKEFQKMFLDPDGQFQQEFLSSLMLEVGHVVVGLNSAQMDFKGVIFQPNYNNNPNNFRNTVGALDHFTINGDETVRTWNISAGNVTLNASNAYYVYAKVPTGGTEGTIYVTTEKITVRQVTGFYHFLCGILNTPRTDTGVTTRSWKPVFGFTEISGSDIVTGVIRDRMNRLIIDLVNGTITGKVTFAAGSSGYDNLIDKPNLADMNISIDHALNLAGNKRRVFTSTPFTPYEAGDLWVNSNKNGGKDLMVCTTTRLTGYYYVNDWGLATNYDKTKTAIDGGVVTSGRIQLVGDAGAIRAGITGGGAANTSVRIWAGGTYEGRGTANARITEEGRIYGRNSIVCENANGYISGGFTSNGTGEGGSGGGSTPGSVRLWVGTVADESNINSAIGNAPFRVTQNGMINCSQINLDGVSGMDSKYRMYAGSIYMGGDGQIIMYSTATNQKHVKIQTSTTSFGSNVLDIKDVEYSGTSDTLPPTVKIAIGRSAYASTPRVWLDCTHAAGWGSSFRVESRYFGDTNQMERTVINAGALMTRAQLQNYYSSLGASGSLNGQPVYADINSGFLYLNV